MSDFFENVGTIKYEGPSSTNPFAFKQYDKNEMVLGKSMEDHLRFAVCYWHNFCWPGSDVFGAGTFDRPWIKESGDQMALAKQKADVAFEFFQKLGTPYYCFHDRDVAPEGDTLAQSNKNFHEIADYLEQKMSDTGVKLLWGTANLFSNPRFCAGGATNPNSDVFAYGAAQVFEAMNVTQRLKGENYVLWGGREGYESLLNTDVKREREQLGRFMQMVVEHKHKIGFKGTILIEPKPQEPTKHQYDYDSATVYGFLKQYGLEDEIKVNIEVNHATLAGHSFQHEVATAASLGILGSIDANRGDPQNGWDTDQFPNDVQEMTLATYEILKAGGFTTGGYNFDTKLRRQSVDRDDLFIGHIGAMDTIAIALRHAAKMIENKTLESFVDERYKSWNTDLGQKILKGEMSLEELSKHVLDNNIEPKQVSGKQEHLENLVNQVIYNG